MIARLSFFLLIVEACLAVAQPLREPSPPAHRDSSQQIAERIINSTQPVLVDFWATWCAPCHMLAPVLKKLEKEYKGKVTFMKVDVDIHRQIAAYFRIQGIPAVFIVNDRAVKKAITGLQPEEAYRKALDAVLEKPPPPLRDTASSRKSISDTL
ncbi:MAG: thioredoxin [Chitinispirillaceae bacterium]|nr:thioredoxin [Chitinispirillaceae bacterium]